MRHLTAFICMLILLGSVSGQTKQSPTRPTPAVVIAPVGSGAKLDPVTGRATESENRETRSQDESIKNLPKGQMEILMSDDTRGTLHSLLQVRPPEEVAIPGFQPALYPRMLHSRAESSGANLRFKDPDLARKYRVPSRQMGGFRK